MASGYHIPARYCLRCGERKTRLPAISSVPALSVHEKERLALGYSPALAVKIGKKTVPVVEGYLAECGSCVCHRPEPEPPSKRGIITTDIYHIARL